VYGAALYGLGHAWYAEDEQTQFHFFNDNAQWNQVDKYGHAYSAYQLSRFGAAGFRMLKKDAAKSAIYGSLLSQGLLLPIEIFDGFSADYGFSWGDILANATGAGVFVSQELLWQRQVVKLKFSYSATGYAAKRPDVLGATAAERLLKDYNGHTYWLSLDLDAFSGDKIGFPRWINIAVGYGAEGMVRAREAENNASGYFSERRYLIGLDLDLSHIESKSAIIKGLIFAVDMIRLPAPALAYSSNGRWGWHWLYF
jgi:uncharacterized protein YfiM (DUF2279 family)